MAQRGKTRKQIEIERRRVTVEVNLLAGASYREIAETLSVSLGTIANDAKAILNAWREHYSQAIEDRRLLQLRRYDVLLNARWEKAKGGDPGAIAQVLTIMDKMNIVAGLVSVDRARDMDEDWEKLAIEDIRAGRVTYPALAEAFGDATLAARLFTAAGRPVPARTSAGNEQDAGAESH